MEYLCSDDQNAHEVTSLHCHNEPDLKVQNWGVCKHIDSLKIETSSHFDFFPILACPDRRERFIWLHWRDVICSLDTSWSMFGIDVGHSDSVSCIDGISVSVWVNQDAVEVNSQYDLSATSHILLIRGEFSCCSVPTWTVFDTGPRVFGLTVGTLKAEYHTCIRCLWC